MRIGYARVSTNDQDTATRSAALKAAGRMMMQMVASFAEFERAMLRERTEAGLFGVHRATGSRLLQKKLAA